MTFVYSLEHLDLSKIKTKEDLLVLMEKHDFESFSYCVHTAKLNYAIALEYGLDQEKDKESLRILFECGLFHDIGKIGMVQEFINYPSSYTIEMYNEMKKHTSGGGFLLEHIHAEKELAETAKFHHCNFDGSGYPGDLYYEEIPFHARLTRLSDSIDAYMSKRCYKDGGPTFEVLQDVEQYKGTSYDPKIIEAFERVHKNIMELARKSGIDRPSKTAYIQYLSAIYCEGFHHDLMDKVHVPK